MMFTKEQINKIDKFLHENFEIMFEFEFNGLLLLMGGAVKGFIMDTPIRDFDFVVLTQENDNILEFIRKYKLKYKINPGHGYTINYNNFLIGLSSTNDLSKVGILSTDFLFYDIHRKQLIPIGIKNSIKKRKIIDVGYFGYPRYEQRVRLKKRKEFAKKFVQFMNNDNKRVRVVRKNKYFRRMFFGFLRNPFKIKKLFRR